MCINNYQLCSIDYDATLCDLLLVLHEMYLFICFGCHLA